MSHLVYRFFEKFRGLPFRSMSVFNWLLEAALCGGLLILVVLALRPLYKRVAGKRIVCLLWVLVFLRLVVPVAIPNPMMNELRPTFSMDAAARPIADQIRVRTNDAINDISWNAINAEVEREVARSSEPREKAYVQAYQHRSENLWDVLQTFGVVMSYGWAGKWVLAGWVLVAVIVGAVLLTGDLRKRNERTKGMQITCVLSHVACALQWFNPLVWVGAWLARQDAALPEEKDENTAAPVRIGCAALAIAVTLCSFCTAESGQKDLRLRASERAYSTSIGSAGETAEHLYGMAEYPALEKMSDAQAANRMRQWCNENEVYGAWVIPAKTTAGWQVSFLREGTPAPLLVLDEHGTLLAWHGPREQAAKEPYTGYIPEDTLQTLTTATERLTQAWQMGAAESLSIAEKSYDEAGVYITVKAEIDGRTRTMVWDIWTLRLISFETGDEGMYAVNLTDAIEQAQSAISTYFTCCEDMPMAVRMEGDQWCIRLPVTPREVNQYAKDALFEKWGTLPEYVFDIRVSVQDGSTTMERVDEELMSWNESIPTDPRREKLYTSFESSIAVGCVLTSSELLPAGTEVELLRYAAVDDGLMYIGNDSAALVRCVSPASGKEVVRWIWGYTAQADAASISREGTRELDFAFIAPDGKERSAKVWWKDVHRDEDDWGTAITEADMPMLEKMMGIVAVQIMETVGSEPETFFAGRTEVVHREDIWQIVVYESENFPNEFDIREDGEILYNPLVEGGNG